MECLSKSIRMDLLMASTANLLAQYTFPFSYTSLPAMDPIFTICPFLLAIICGTISLETYNNPSTLVCSMASQSLISAVSNESFPAASPALLINKSICCHSADNVPRFSATAFLSCTSKTSASTEDEKSFSNSIFNAFSRSALRPVIMSRSPSAANFFAQASPIPEVAPVINTVLFISFILLLLGHLKQ